MFLVVYIMQQYTFFLTVKKVYCKFFLTSNTLPFSVPNFRALSQFARWALFLTDWTPSINLLKFLIDAKHANNRCIRIAYELLVDTGRYGQIRVDTYGCMQIRVDTYKMRMNSRSDNRNGIRNFLSMLKKLRTIRSGGGAHCVRNTGVAYEMRQLRTKCF